MPTSQKKKVNVSAGLNPTQVLREDEDIRERLIDLWMMHLELEGRLHQILQKLNYSIRCLRAMPKD